MLFITFNNKRVYSGFISESNLNKYFMNNLSIKFSECSFRRHFEM